MWIIWVLGLIGLFFLIGLGVLVFGRGKQEPLDDEQVRRMSPRTRKDYELRLNTPSPKLGGAAIMSVALVLGFILIALNSVKVIGANEVGVASTLGTNVRSVDSGVSLVNPISEITKYPTRPRTRVVDVQVRTADQGYAGLRIAARWGVNRSGATTLFGEFPKKSNDEIENDVVDPNIAAAASEFYGGLTNLDAIDGRKYSANAAGIETLAKALLAKHGINADAVQIRLVQPSKEMTADIQRVNKQRQDTLVADESIKTAKKQAEQQLAAAQGLKDAAAKLNGLSDTEISLLCLQAAERISNGNTQKGLPTYSLPCQENMRTITK
jgi:regulator of protease activity HflC (stomatin/prohibitin superfamily)